MTPGHLQLLLASKQINLIIATVEDSRSSCASDGTGNNGKFP
jgi:hypothetical protein